MNSKWHALTTFQKATLPPHGLPISVSQRTRSSWTNIKKGYLTSMTPCPSVGICKDLVMLSTQLLSFLTGIRQL